MFGQRQLTTASMRELRDTSSRMTTRELPNCVLVLRGDDGRRITEVNKRVSKALQYSREADGFDPRSTS